MSIKCFLSHSSSDKEHYVRPLFNELKRSGSERIIYDEMTFEEGMKTIDEINVYLNETSLFVIFLSNASLDSDWVKYELCKAKDLFDENKIKRIYPIIIDSNITYDDNRIPDWMKDDLNVQPILKYQLAANKIKTRLREISWQIHPRLKEREQIFVGRNDVINKIEQRLDDIDLCYPITLISTGLPYIGRKSTLRHALIKANVIKDFYQFIDISLDYNDGIEDFILRIVDSGLYDLNSIERNTLFYGEFADKLKLAKDIINSIVKYQEKIFINDNACIVQRNGEIVDWFKDILECLYTNGYTGLLFCIKTQFKLKSHMIRDFPYIFSFNIKELDVSERKGLISRYSKFQDIRDSIKNEDLSFFVDLLTGYPEQVFFAVDQIKEYGVSRAKKLSHLIQQYSSDKARIVLDKYKNNLEKIEFIALLSKFEFITFDILFEIVDEKVYEPILEELLSESICELFGKASEYIRLNNIVKDYISRNKFGYSNSFDNSLEHYVEKFYKNYDEDNFDITGYQIAAKENLIKGMKYSSDMILPSVILKVIKQLYDIEKNYDEVISLSKYILDNKKNIHKNMIDYVRFIKCQSLARQRKTSEFFDEVRNISDEAEREFLIGFLYRIQGKTVKAEECLNKALIGKGYDDPKIIGELIRVYMQNEEYEKAYEFSEKNYNRRPENLINVNDYFTCLLMKDEKRENRKVLENIISRLEIDPSDKAQEILLSMKARISLFYDNDCEKSFEFIEEAENRFPNVSYPLLTKADLAIYVKDYEKLRDAVLALDPITRKNAQTYRSYIKYKAILLAMENKKGDAIRLVMEELSGLNENNKKRLFEKINQYENIINLQKKR